MYCIARKPTRSLKEIKHLAFPARSRLLTGEPRYYFDVNTKAIWGNYDLKIRGRYTFVNGRRCPLITHMWVETVCPFTRGLYWQELVADDAMVESLLGPDFYSAN